MKIAQFGTFDIENYGDLLFPLLAQRRIKSSLGAEIQPVSPIGGAPIWDGAPSSISATTFAKNIHEYQAILIGGGNIIRSTPSNVGTYANATNGVAHYADLWLGATKAAATHTPVAWLSPGVPTPFPICLHKSVEECLKRTQLISVRDIVSKQNLMEVVSDADVFVAPDIAWEVNKLWGQTELDSAYTSLFKRIGVSIPNRSVVFHVNDRYVSSMSPEVLAVRLDSIASALAATPILLAIGPCHGDSELARAVAPCMKTNPILIDQPKSIIEVASCLRGACAYIGSAMHGFITAASFDVPSLCVASLTTIKFEGLRQQLGIDTAVVEKWDSAVDFVRTVGFEKQNRSLSQAKVRIQTELDDLWNNVVEVFKKAPTQPAPSDKATGMVPLLEARVESLAIMYRQINEGQKKVRQLERYNRSLSSELRSIHNSISWKLTIPLRKASSRYPQLATNIILLGRTLRKKARIIPLLRWIVQVLRRTKRPVWEPETDIVSKIEVYRKRDQSLKRKIVVYTAIAGGYDSLFVPEQVDPDIDYVCFSDTPQNGYGVWQMWPMPYYHPDPTRRARYVKTHPNSLFPDHEVAVWVDANIIIRGDVKKYVAVVQDGNHDVGFIPHPLRNCVYDEASACIELNKDSPDQINLQIERYRSMGYPSGKGMMETNFFVALIRKPATASLFRHWWGELDRYSRRDQLSVGYALDQSRVNWVHLTPQGTCCRNSPDFKLFPHAMTKHVVIPKALKAFRSVASPYDGKSFYDVKEERLAKARKRPADIIVCVYNALDDVKLCLEAARRHLEPEHKIIIVNDKSNEETTEFLRSFAKDDPKVTLIENEVNLGYTKSANRGLAAGTSDFRIMLNSDTIVPKNWLLKLIDLAYSSENIAIVGPMSNAASWQSVPNIKSTFFQTAINQLPDGVTVDDIDICCEKWSPANATAITPLIHGFCFGIRASVIKAIGLFDDINFERFYGEENDYCFRARKAGFDLAVATNTFVFHKKSRSIKEEERIVWMAKTNNRLREIHGKDQIALACRQMADHPLIVRLRTTAASKWDKRIKEFAQQK